ncbi:MAG: type IV pilus modification protein PilV [Pseudoxanthomonas sp.]|nr:type IV pilus modification protein PilV [Pseudoxanthomonas sp.]
MATSRLPSHARQQGYSLLEVLIALLVFSIGLLGLAAMLVSAVKGNHQAYHHSQAVYVAEAMADGLRANLAAVNAGAYNTGGFITGPTAAPCGPCTAAQTAARDRAAWAAMAAQRLPGGAISVDCTAGAAGGFTAAGYAGVCTLGVRWSEVGDTGQSQDVSQRAFTWMVQP